MAFDISKFASSAPVPASDSDTMLEIPVENIVDNPRNFYPRPDGDASRALMESIEANGLLEPPTVVPDAGVKAEVTPTWWMRLPPVPEKGD